MLAARPAPATAPPTKVRPAPSGVMRAKLSSRSGQTLAIGTARVRRTVDGWQATIRALDRPGAIARAYYTAGLRDIVLELGDGRRAPGHITGTSFSLELNERTCEICGASEFV